MRREIEQSGRIAALEILYAEHGPHILRYLNRLVGPRLAEDVLQDTFVQVLSYPNELDGIVSMRAWLFRIARNCAMNRVRKKKATTDIPLDSLVTSHPNEDPRLGLMRDAIEQLPQEHRETLLLRWHDELSYEEIAQVQQIPVGTVRSRLHHSLRRLRDRMEEKLAVDM